MEEVQEPKQEIRDKVSKILESISDEELFQKTRQIESRLFEFANFLEAKIALLYSKYNKLVDSQGIIQKCFDFNKIVVLPAFNTEKYEMNLMKVDNLDTDLILGVRGILEPNPEQCKHVPIECVDIAIIPGIAFDEKGGRLGTGGGFYDRLIPKLSVTTRKVAVALEEQIVPQVHMESHDKHVDIIITDRRIIYKI